MSVFLLLPVTASSYDFLVNGVAYKVLSMADLTVEVTSGCLPDNGKLHIPATVEFKGRIFTVLGIGEKTCDTRSLTDLTIDEGPTYINDEAFSLQQMPVVRIPKTITRIGVWGFYQNMGHYDFLYNWVPDPMELIIEDGDSTLTGESKIFFGSAFRECHITRLYMGRNLAGSVVDESTSWMEEVVIGDRVTSLTTETLGGYLINLKKLTIGKRLEEVPYLNEGDKIEEIYLRSKTPPVSLGFKDGTYITATLYVPKGSKDAYMNANVWKEFWTIEEYEVDPDAGKVFPEDGTTDFSISDEPCITFLEDDNNINPTIGWGDIVLHKGDLDGEVVDGYVYYNNSQDEDSGKYRYKVAYRITDDLEINTWYTFCVPADAIISKNGRHPLKEDVVVRFKTVDLKKMTLTASINEDCKENGTVITLTCSEPDAEIRYTLDYTVPDTTSTLYTGPITSDKDNTSYYNLLWAKAYKDGYVVPHCMIRNLTIYPVTDVKSIEETDRPPEFYDILGRKIPTDDTTIQLQKGVYNINGKIVIVNGPQ